MTSLLPFDSIQPSLEDGVFVADTARVIGDVHMGAESSVWFGSVLRGDVTPLFIGRRTNIQDLCMVHGTTGEAPVRIGDDVTVGHRAIVHGCTVGNGVLVGMGSVLLDNCTIGDFSVVAAGAVVPPGMTVPSGTLVAGVPAKVVRELDENSRGNMLASATRYAQLARQYQEQR